jgi:hypothetical protein
MYSINFSLKDNYNSHELLIVSGTEFTEKEKNRNDYF